MRAASRMLYFVGLLCSITFLTSNAEAISVTQTSTFASDDSVFSYDLSVTATQSYEIWTTSYGGGNNLNGTTSSAGGFVPVITVFSATTGNVVAFDGGDGTCAGFDRKDPGTGMCDDAFVATTLLPGSYVVDLTEFPNVANGNMSDGFLFAGDPTATGDVCGVTGGMFLEADVAPCVQRTSTYSLNVASTPEPATLWMGIPLLAAFLYHRRRDLIG